jgi:hypothetical protein
MEQLSKEQIIEKMVDEMPHHFPVGIKPYISEAMDIHSKQTAIAFAEWFGGKYIRMFGGWMPYYADQRMTENLITTEQLYELFLQSLNK